MGCSLHHQKVSQSQNSMIKKIRRKISSFLVNTSIEIPTSDDLIGKIIIVTGSSKGLGKVIGSFLLNQGANVVFISRGENPLSKTSDSKKTLFLKADVSNIKDVENSLNKTISKFGKIDVLINNVGIYSQKPIENFTLKDFENITKTNLQSVFLMSKAVIPSMKKQKEGLIINIGSKVSHNTNAGEGKTLYAATKYAVEGFSLALNNELKKWGIRVSCLMPGTINTYPRLDANKILSPYQVASLISNIIRFKDIDFESVVFKSRWQKI